MILGPAVGARCIYCLTENSVITQFNTNQQVNTHSICVLCVNNLYINTPNNQKQLFKFSIDNENTRTCCICANNNNLIIKNICICDYHMLLNNSLINYAEILNDKICEFINKHESSQQPSLDICTTLPLDICTTLPELKEDKSKVTTFENSKVTTDGTGVLNLLCKKPPTYFEIVMKQKDIEEQSTYSECSTKKPKEIRSIGSKEPKEPKEGKKKYKHITCKKCLNDGHSEKECSVDITKFCTLCQKYGHHEKMCGVICSKCNRKGHHVNKCKMFF